MVGAYEHVTDKGAHWLGKLLLAGRKCCVKKLDIGCKVGVVGYRKLVYVQEREYAQRVMHVQ